MTKVAVISGGAQGIGKEIVLNLISNNVITAVIDSNAQAGYELVHEVNNGAFLIFINADITDEKDVKQAINTITRRTNRIDYLINNAAITINKHIEEITLDEWNKVIATNLTGTFLMTKYTAPYLHVSKGQIINLSSTRAIMSEPNTEAYSASKGGILALTHALSMSMAPDVRVNCISPGWIDVASHNKNKTKKSTKITQKDNLQHPVGRVGKPSDIANMVWFLLSQDDSFITGQNFVIDGGMTKKMIYV